VVRRYRLNVDIGHRAIGLVALESEGSTFSAEAMAACTAADGLILGPVDTFIYPAPAEGGINPSAALRTGLDLYANVRPAKARPGVRALTPDMDLVIVRENTEGFYADRNMFQGSGEFMPSPDMALAVRKVTISSSRRIARSALELARARRKHLTIIHKANVLKVSDGLFLRTCQEEAKTFPDITVDELIVDAAAAMLVRKPGSFDVLVATNMFGDILSDEAGELSGGLGLAPSINAGDRHAMAQAVHGSAPDIAGRGVANPTALIGSVALLLEWLGQRGGHNDLISASAGVRTALDQVLADPTNHTADLGGSVQTDAFGDLVARAVADSNNPT
jgi:isocitrate/isopropylmalate dehydrogenase